MAKFESGALGRFDGKVGTIVGAKWKGVDYIRHKGTKRTPSTRQQIEQQAKFKTVIGFTNTLSNLLSKTYPATNKTTQQNAAFKEIYKNALEGSFPAFNINYSKVSVSKGTLHNAYGPAVSAAGHGMVKFTWTDNTSGDDARGDDLSVLVAYCPETDQVIYNMNGADRGTGVADLNLVNFSGKTVETWIAFISANGKRVSTSIYTGSLIV